MRQPMELALRPARSINQWARFPFCRVAQAKPAIGSFEFSGAEDPPENCL